MPSSDNLEQTKLNASFAALGQEDFYGGYQHWGSLLLLRDCQEIWAMSLNAITFCNDLEMLPSCCLKRKLKYRTSLKISSPLYSDITFYVLCLVMVVAWCGIWIYESCFSNETNTNRTVGLGIKHNSWRLDLN